MAKFIARLVVTLACLYGAGVGAFAYFHYDAGQRPELPGLLSEFHGWLGSLVSTRNDAKPSEPARPPLPEAAPTPPAPPPEPAETLSSEEQELLRIRREVIPAVEVLAEKLRSMDRADGEAFERARTEALAKLGDARSFLNELLEKDAHHRAANALITTVNVLYKKLRSL